MIPPVTRICPDPRDELLDFHVPTTLAVDYIQDKKLTPISLNGETAFVPESRPVLAELLRKRLRPIPLEATHLRGNTYAVRPAGRTGTCGFSPVPWTVQYIKASSAMRALAKATPLFHPPRIGGEPNAKV